MLAQWRLPQLLPQGDGLEIAHTAGRFFEGIPVGWDGPATAAFRHFLKLHWGTRMRSRITTLLLASAAAMIAHSASAAGLSMTPIYKGAPHPIVAWDWTGPYVGAFVGVGVSRSRGRDPRGIANGGHDGDLEHTGYGLSAGGTIGY